MPAIPTGQLGREVGDRALVIGAVEVRGRASGRVRFQAVPDASSTSLTGFAHTTVEPGTAVITDGWQGLRVLSGLGYPHSLRTKGRLARADIILPRVHRVFGNLKTWLCGTHHGVDPKHLQAYLDGFIFRFNRHRMPMAAFQSLRGLTGAHGPMPEQSTLDCSPIGEAYVATHCFQRPSLPT